MDEDLLPDVRGYRWCDPAGVRVGDRVLDDLNIPLLVEEVVGPDEADGFYEFHGSDGRTLTEPPGGLVACARTEETAVRNLERVVAAYSRSGA
jgi:hypothetical protein